MKLTKNILLILILFCSACTQNKILTPSNSSIPKELLKLSKLGNYYFNNQVYTQAIDTYSLLLEEFPNSAYQQLALFGIADSYYKMGRYDLSSRYYNKILDTYSDNDSLGYLLVKTALSEHKLYKGFGRGSDNLKKAISLYNSYLNKDTSQKYLTFVTEQLNIAKTQLAEFEDYKEEYYSNF